jgi:hypothetical protein
MGSRIKAKVRVCKDCGEPLPFCKPPAFDPDYCDGCLDARGLVMELPPGVRPIPDELIPFFCVGEEINDSDEADQTEGGCSLN